MRREALQWHQQTEHNRSIVQHKRSVTGYHSQHPALGQHATRVRAKTAPRAAKDNRSHADWDLMLDATWANFENALSRNSHVCPALLCSWTCLYMFSDSLPLTYLCTYMRFRLNDMFCFYATRALHTHTHNYACRGRLVFIGTCSCFSYLCTRKCSHKRVIALELCTHTHACMYHDVCASDTDDAGDMPKPTKLNPMPKPTKPNPMHVS